jgi:hypothetical protein
MELVSDHNIAVGQGEGAFTKPQFVSCELNVPIQHPLGAEC